MISVLIFSSVEEERNKIIKYYKNIVAHYSDDECQFHVFDGSCGLDDVFRHIMYVDIACIDVTTDIGVKVAERIREQSKFSTIVIIADNSVSPAEYVKLSVGVNALLMRPIECSLIQKVLYEVFEYYKANRYESNEKEFLVIENKEGKQIVPYRCIFYFEAREKKIVAVTEKKEICFYGTLDNLVKELPHSFIRCHRSFIISCRKVSCVKLSEHTICLVNGIMIPLSRKYRNIVREMILK